MKSPLTPEQQATNVEALASFLRGDGMQYQHQDGSWRDAGNAICIDVSPHRPTPFVLGDTVNGFTLGPGQRWHRTDWTRDMLPEGTRPLLDCEERENEDEWSYPDGIWRKVKQYGPAGLVVDANHAHCRTTRQLPPAPAPAPELVPLEPWDVPPGSAVRHPGVNGWEMVLLADGERVQTFTSSWKYEELMGHHLHRPGDVASDGTPLWRPMRKPRGGKLLKLGEVQP